MNRMLMGGVVLGVFLWASSARAQNETCPGQDVDLSSLGRCSANGVTETGTTTGAADDIDESNEVSCWGASDAAEVVYSFTLNYGRLLQIDLEGSGYDTKLAIVQGCPDGSNFCIFNDDYSSTFQSGFDCQYFDAGTYSVIVSGFNGHTGDFVLHIDECEQGCSENDFCPGEALDMSFIHTCGGATVQAAGSTVDATDDIDETSEVSCWDQSQAPERVYSFHLDFARALQVDLEGSDYDTKMAIVQGCPDGGNFCIYNDDYSSLQSGFDCQVFQPGDYSVIVSGFAGHVGNFALNLTECETACPANEVCPGDAVDLSALTPESGQTMTVSGTTSDATDDIDEVHEVSCWRFSGAAEKLHSFTLTQDTYLQITLEGSDYDTKMAVVDSCPEGDTFCRYNDDYNGSYQSGFDCEQYSAGTYSVIVSGYFGDRGDYQLNFTECHPVCGNGVVEDGETCDDGNNDDTDDCPGTCVAASCGDGFVWAGHEDCDDGNSANTDDCLNTCTAATCGDGYVWAGHETCDDGNSVNTDSCPGTCTAATCGDGYVWAGHETCDDGNNDDTDNCPGTCQPAVCGDGYVWAGHEECDDGNTANGDGCSSICAIEAVCGNGVPEAGEECDDGNGDNTDACLSTCVAASCGDGFVWAGHEECDDDNSDNTDDCLNTCVAASCGDGFVWAGHEECDDGNSDDTDDCPGTCVAASCGDGFVWAGHEECDDGNSVDTDDCPGTCVAANCGDGFVWAGHEECDDGNSVDTDDCPGTCAAATCGDGFIWAGHEECDDGNSDNTDDCPGTCVAPTCGDGFVWAGHEECDDGNSADGDGCSSTCTAEPAVCGNSIVEDGEDCDDGNTTDGDGCSATCQNEGNAVCGNGELEKGETCDDANTLSGDGCSATCAVEAGWACMGKPSSCCEDADGDHVCDGSGSSSDSGCGCSASGGAGDLGWIFVLLLGLPLIRRRRRR